MTENGSSNSEASNASLLKLLQNGDKIHLKIQANSVRLIQASDFEKKWLVPCEQILDEYLAYKN